MQPAEHDHIIAQLRGAGLTAECAAQCTGALQSVAGGERWIARLDQLAEAVAAGSARHRLLESHILELKVMSYLLRACGEEIAYEPAGQAGDKTCDLLLQVGTGNVLVEIKTLQPIDQETRIPYEHITPGNRVIMDPVLYHHFQAGRGHLLDMAFDVEEKLACYVEQKLGVMAIWTNFYLDVESYRDFVAFYRGQPRVGDPLAVMSTYELSGRNFAGTIDQFWAFPFNQFDCGFRCGEPSCVAPFMSSDRSIADSIAQAL